MTAPECCASLDERLRAWPGTDLRGLSEWLQSLSGIECCVAAGLREARRSADWWTFERYVLAAFYHPSRAYTEVLCDVLALREELNNEDIVDTLAEIADPQSVDCLRAAMRWEPPWDEFGQLARKAVWALAAIGTSEAMASIHEATDDEREKPREAAIQAVGRAEG
jgi:hypothetical protein